MNGIGKRGTGLLAAALMTSCLLSSCGGEAETVHTAPPTGFLRISSAEYPMDRVHDKTENTDLNANDGQDILVGAAAVENYRLGNEMVDTVRDSVSRDDQLAAIQEEQRAQGKTEIREYEEAERIRIAEEEARRAAEEARRLEEQRRAEEAALRAKCPGYNEAFISQMTEKEQAEAEWFREQGFVFFRQNWESLDDLPYGDDGFGQCGCGPTCVAEIIANLTGIPVTPEDMRVYGIEHNSYPPGTGTTYDFMLSTPKKYGIKVTNIGHGVKKPVVDALKAGKLILACMGPGDFTLGAHFMLYRGVTDDGKILIADSYDYEHSVRPWDFEELEAQLKNGYYIFELDTEAETK